MLAPLIIQREIGSLNEFGKFAINYLEYPVNISKLKNQETEYFQSSNNNSTPFPFPFREIFDA